jgi:hypothetical protein
MLMQLIFLHVEQENKVRNTDKKSNFSLLI